MRQIFAMAALWACSAAHASDAFDTSAANLIAVLRETPGANKQQEDLRPVGPIRMQLPDGREVQFEASWYQYLGDMHLRLVFDGEQRLQNAVPDDLQRLRLTPEEALRQAVENLRRRYGPPQAQPFAGGLMKVEAASPGVASSYFLDRDFWDTQLRTHPAGIVAAVPARGGIVFGPADDDAVLTSLRFSAAALYAGDARMRLSSALYLFRDGHWSVYQAAQGAAP